MARPKSDLKPILIKLGDADRALLAKLAPEVDPPTQTEVVRVALREFARRRRAKAARKNRAAGA